MLHQWILFKGNQHIGFASPPICYLLCCGLWGAVKSAGPATRNCCIMTQWNVPYQESLGSLKQYRQTCTNMLLCLWRGKALMEIIGLLGSDISKCAICFLPLYPYFGSLKQFPCPVPPVTAVLWDNTHTSLILPRPLCLSAMQQNDDCWCVIILTLWG